MRASRFLLVVLPMLTAACSGGEVRQSLGLNQKAPDEFVVYSRPPLSVPPEFDLRPPRPGEENPTLTTPEDDARQLLLGTKRKPASLDGVEAAPSVETAVVPVLAADAPSQAQSSFLSKAGADKVEGDIRKQLQADKVAEPQKKKKAQSLYEELVSDDKTEPVVDAKKEAERIRANKDTNKPITDGETPVEDQKKKSVLDRIF
jgi:hypothetical protein